MVMTRVARVDRPARCRKLCLGRRRQAGPCGGILLGGEGKYG